MDQDQFIEEIQTCKLHLPCNPELWDAGSQCEVLNFIHYPAICILQMRDVECGVTKYQNFIQPFPQSTSRKLRVAEHATKELK